MVLLGATVQVGLYISSKALIPLAVNMPVLHRVGDIRCLHQVLNQW
jgi:hypothetical protein